MTVCIATITNNSTVIGASDRMMTAGNIQFEPRQTKVIPLSSSIVLMVAGDAAVHSEIIYRLSTEVYGLIQNHPLQWLRVGYVGELYSAHYNAVRMKLIEREVLAPYGLNSESFLSRQKQLSERMVEIVHNELMNFRHLGTAAIVAGVDDSGPHLYSIVDGDIACQDLVGFAAIGIGCWHANSQLMLGGHTRYAPFSETLYLTYLAKKRAEVAPGVGRGTDMFMIGPQLGSYQNVVEVIVDGLHQNYEENVRDEESAMQDARTKVEQYMRQLLAAAQEATKSVDQKPPENSRSLP